MALALDEPTDEDAVEKVGDFTFCVQQSLLTDIGGVNIDISYMGFVVEPLIPLARSASSCGSCGSGASCSM